MTDTIQTIHQKVNQYKYVIETQEKDAFYALWAEKYETSLISVNTCFIVSGAIYRDFLIGGIRKAYSKIEFEIKTADVRLLTDDCAVVIFLYEIHCTRRETGEPYGIAGLETQVYVKENKDWKLAHMQYAKV